MNTPVNPAVTALQEAAARLKATFGDAPEGAVVLGSGLSGFASGLTEAKSASYAELGLPTPGVEGHSGVVSTGLLGGKRLALLAGRLHLYEGHSPDRVVFAVRAMALWGVRKLVLTSAVGSLFPEVGPGSLVRVTDHINLMGRNPLIGDNLELIGPRFPDMGHAYDRALGHLADQVAEREGIHLHRGVYAAMLGPSYETPAEIRMLRQMGGNVVGMSTVPEVIAARHAGVAVLTISVVSNLAAGLAEEHLSHVDVTRVVGEAAPVLSRLVAGVVARW